MLALKLFIEFDCCVCENYIGATLKCSGRGDGPVETTGAIATLNCPHCCQLNQVLFTLDGSVHEVAPELIKQMVLEPSFN